MPRGRPARIVSSNTSGIPIGCTRGGPQRRFQASLARYPFLQPAALPAPARADSDGRDRPGRARAGGLVRRSSSRQGRRRREGHAELHREPYRSVRRHAGAAALGTSDYTIEEIDAITGPALGRPKSATFRTMDIAGIDVLAHVASNLAERLDDPAMRTVFEVPPLVAPDDRARTGRREVGTGLLQTREESVGRIRNSDARSRDADLPAAPVAAPALPRRGAQHRRCPPNESERSSSDRIGWANSCARRWGRCSSTQQTLRPRSPIRLTMSIGRCGGDLAGSWVRSKRGMRLALNEVLEAVPGATDPTARRRVEGHRQRPIPRRGRCRPPPPTSQILAAARGPAAGCQKKRRRQPGRPRRRRAGRRVPLEDEHNRRRHGPDAAGGRQGSGGQLRRAGRWQRGCRTSPPARTSCCS